MLILLATPQIKADEGEDENAVASEDEIYINIRTRHSRSIISNLPRATILENQLVISFYGSGVYSLIVQADAGYDVYEAVLPADGTAYSFDLSVLDDGYYRLVLEGPAGEYEGYFFID